MDKISKIISDIKTLKIQGAREIAKTGIKVLVIAAKESKAKTAKALFEELDSTAKKFISVRPTESALRNVLARIIADAKRSEIENVGTLRKFVYELSEKKLAKFDSDFRRIASYGMGLIKDGDVVLTHCHSHLVIEILRQAKAQGKKFKVIVTETRPLYQGLKTAKELLAAGVPVIYCEDSAVGYVMKSVTKVLVGCDAILEDGSIVNKIGTFPVAVVAKRFNRPFYSAGETLKIWSGPIEIEQRSPVEIIDPRKLPGAKIINPAFDVTPAEFVEGIITEKGILKPERIGGL